MPEVEQTNELIVNNYINSFQAREFRLFKQIDVVFNERFNFIVGPNASGKTSILRAMANCLTSNNCDDTRYKPDTAFHTDYFYNNHYYRIGLDNTSVCIANSYREALGFLIMNKPIVGRDNYTTYDFYNVAKQASFLCPLFMGPYRKIDYKKMQGMQREATTTASQNKYITNSVQYLYSSFTPNVKQWMVNRYFITEKDWATEEKANWVWLISKLSCLAPIESNFQFLEIKQDLEPTFQLFGKIVYLEELSAGFQAVLSLIFSIFEWIEATNDGDNKLIKNAKGTVLIDELDVHLHPEWQLNIRNALETIFPHLQFICTTHSPHIIASAKPGEVIIIYDSSDGIYDLKPSTKAYSGWSTDQILEHIMGVKSLDNKLYEKLYNEALDALDESNITLVKDMIDKLTQITYSKDTRVETLKIKLAKLQLEACDD